MTKFFTADLIDSMRMIEESTFIQTAGIVLFFFILILISKKTTKEGYIYSIVENPFSVNKKKKTKGKGLIKSLLDKIPLLSKNEKKWMEMAEQSKAELHQVIYFDRLTNLPNRVYLKEEFRNKIEAYTDDQFFNEIAVFVVDVDRFRIINELYGRDAGNQVLIKVTERLKALLGEEALIARESEDELFILMEEVSEEQIKQIGKDIVDLFTKPFRINDSIFYVTVSIGMSRYPETAQDIDALLQQAEIAMYKVKQSGKNSYHLFMADDAAAIERKRRIEVGLKEALVHNELYLVYQPKVEIETEKMYGVEALLRWEHPILGSVSPGEFIPIAEETGMINEIGYWVIYEAVKQAREWHNQDIYISMAVNASALQFEDQYFVKRIKNILKLYELDAKYFMVEITESIMKDVDYANRAIKELHESGISVAIDDFGTGYSSLSVLNNIFIDVVKIDKSFIDHVINKTNTASLVKTMIEMGKNLNFNIVAEGIENREQAIFLKENKCQYGQGYYFSKPLPPEKITTLSLGKGHGE